MKIAQHCLRNVNLG